MNGNALIIGCGYLGKVLARQLREAGDRVAGMARRESSLAPLQSMGIEAFAIDITSPAGAQAIADIVRRHAIDDAYCCVPPSIDADPVAVFTRIADALRGRSLRRAVLTSSTAVYGDQAGGLVDADTPATPGDARGQRLAQIETAWLSIGAPARVVRMAGLYGPGRVIGASAIAAGAPIGGNADDLLNLIHIEDAAALLRAVATRDGAGVVELGADGVAMTRRDYYNAVAERLGRRAIFDAGDAGFGGGRRTGSRRCDIGVTCRRTGWTPVFADARRQLAALLPNAP